MRSTISAVARFGGDFRSFAFDGLGVPRNETGTAAEWALRLDFDLVAYPNPANSKAVLELRLPRRGPATLDVSDARGRRLRRLMAQNQAV